MIIATENRDLAYHILGGGLSKNIGDTDDGMDQQDTVIKHETSSVNETPTYKMLTQKKDS